MIYINGNFELVATTEDIVRVCKEYVNDEFAEAVQNMFETLEDEVYESEEELHEKEKELEDSCENKIDMAQEAIQTCIADLKTVCNELEDWK